MTLARNFMRYLRAEGGWKMHGPSHWAWGHCPVRWLNRHALVVLPERVEESNAKPVSEQWLSIVNSDVLVLILDMTGTAACDHAGGEALNQVYQRAMASGTARWPGPPGARGSPGWPIRSARMRCSPNTASIPSSGSPGA